MLLPALDGQMADVLETSRLSTTGKACVWRYVSNSRICHALQYDIYNFTRIHHLVFALLILSLHSQQVSTLLPRKTPFPSLDLR